MLVWTISSYVSSSMSTCVIVSSTSPSTKFRCWSYACGRSPGWHDAGGGREGARARDPRRVSPQASPFGSTRPRARPALEGKAPGLSAALLTLHGGRFAGAPSHGPPEPCGPRQGLAPGAPREEGPGHLAGVRAVGLAPWVAERLQAPAPTPIRPPPPPRRAVAPFPTQRAREVAGGGGAPHARGGGRGARARRGA